MNTEKIIDELIAEAELEPGWTAVSALQVAKKELQKPAIPKKAPSSDASRTNGSWYYICGRCNHPIDWRDNYCRECGIPIDWTTS